MAHTWAMSPDAVRAAPVHELARMAGCRVPDTDECNGAGVLFDVRDGVLAEFDALVEEYGVGSVRLRDLIAECERDEVDTPSQSTRGVWYAFVDLGAYEGDVASYQGKVILDDIAMHMVSLITDRLMHALAQSLCRWADEQDDDGTA